MSNNDREADKPEASAAVENRELYDRVMTQYTVDISAMEEENRLLRDTVSSLKDELTKFNRVPLLVAEVRDVVGEHALLRLHNGNEFFVEISSNAGKIKAGDMILAEQKNLTVLRKIDANKRFNVEQFVIVDKPSLGWESIGGLQKQIEEIREVIELPLKKPQLFVKVGIQPPKGLLLYGPPGTGKTLLAKAVASSTSSTFIELVGSELVQKFIGEGAKLVNEIFELARAKAPAIIFIDELDAIAAQRIEIGTSGEREVQRTFMQLLAEIDGFNHLGNVKVIGCTNRKDILDPAILRPGRLDRLIYVPNPDLEGIGEIFRIHSSAMTLDKKINPAALCKKMEGFSGAEIKAVCTEAGYFAIRENRIRILPKDFAAAIEKVKSTEQREGKDYLNMFG
ncbi:MAG TPA: AAA family ATPase [Candidatus Nanoarchaeia archaeon]|nr:AAA family ATPase [Candidatus Nanoarchaeia archaeon]